MSRKPPARAELACPACQQKAAYVHDPRGTDDGTRIRRKRVCSQCGHRWSTTEWPNEALTEAQAQAILDFAHKALAAFHRKAA